MRGAPSRYRPEAIRDLWLDWPAMRNCRTEPQAAVAARRRRREEAAALASELASLWPVSKELMAAKQWADAAPIFDRLARAWPHDYELRVSAAATAQAVPDNAAMSLGHAEAAAALCAARQTPHCLVVKCLLQLGRQDEALEYVESSIVGKPNACFRLRSHVESLAKHESPGSFKRFRPRIGHRWRPRGGRRICSAR